MYELARDVETEPGSTRRPCESRSAAVELLEDALLLGEAQPGAGVGDRDAHRTALGVIRVAEAEMTRALRVISVQRGLDPREFALVAFGGAGG